MLTLFVAPYTVAMAPHIALEETGLSHTIQWLSFASNDQRKADYLAVNPKGRVPALTGDHGVLTEAPAILEYIADLSGQLMPADTFARAKVREMMSYLASTMHPNHAHGVRGERWSDDPAAHASMAAKVPETMNASCAHVESSLPDNGWFVGDYSVADIHLFNVCCWLPKDGVDIADYPKLAAHFAAMQARPAVMRTLKLTDG